MPSAEGEEGEECLGEWWCGVGVRWRLLEGRSSCCFGFLMFGISAACVSIVTVLLLFLFCIVYLNIDVGFSSFS